MTRQIKSFFIVFFIALTMLCAVSGFAANYTFGTEFKVNTYTSYEQSNPAIVSNGQDYLVTWSSFVQDGSDYGVFGQRIDSSGTFLGSEFQINTHTTHFQDYSAVASNGQNYLITWQSDAQDGAGIGIYGQRINSSGTFLGSEFKINTYTTDSQFKPAVVSDGQDYLVSWHSFGQDGDSWGVYGQRIDTSGSFKGSEFKINTCTVSSQSNPSLASNGQNYLVSWNSSGQDGSQGGIYGQLINTNGNFIGSEFKINTYTANEQWAPAIASNDQDYLVAWMSREQDGLGYGIYGQLIDSSGNFIGAEFLINTYTASDQEYPAIASNGDDFIVTWQSYGQDGYSDGIYGQKIDSFGNLIGDEFLINTYTASNQQHPAIASNGDDFIVAWDSYGQDGSDDGVYAKFMNKTNDVIPEPASILLLLSGIGFLFGKRYRR
ncbi:PEP-CTERM sorting domain-containing protein [bacterium]|nr:PEP-CTERM sorting domain-containing protein [bacterium]